MYFHFQAILSEDCSRKQALIKLVTEAPTSLRFLFTEALSQIGGTSKTFDSICN